MELQSRLPAHPSVLHTATVLTCLLSSILFLQLSRVMELQSRITTAHRGGPLVRHVAMPVANASYHSTPYWPAVIVV